MATNPWDRLFRKARGLGPFLGRKTARTIPRSPSERCRPQVECLEERISPAITLLTDGSANTPLPAATAESAYLNGGQPVTITAVGSTAPYTISYPLTNSTLHGIMLSATTGGKVTLSGTPTQAGTIGFALVVSDKAGDQARQTFSLTIATPITFTPESQSLPAGTVGVPYTFTVSAAGGTGPLTYSLGDNGANNSSDAADNSVPNFASVLPPGLTLAAGGQISGTPVQPGVYDIIITATDQDGVVGRELFPLTISAPATGSAITLSPYGPTTGTTVTLPTATVGTAYLGEGLTISAGGTDPGPYNFSLTTGELPPGMYLSSQLPGSAPSTSTVLEGNPAFWGQFPFTITASDPNTNSSASQSYILNVPAPVAFAITGSSGGSSISPITAANVIPQTIEYYYAVAGKPYSLAVSAGNSDSYDYTLNAAKSSSVASTLTTPISTAIAAASSGQDLSTTTTIDVLSTNGFPASGKLNVATTSGTTQITYTGTTPTSFIGCTGGSGTLQTGGLVTPAFTPSAVLSFTPSQGAAYKTYAFDLQGSPGSKSTPNTGTVDPNGNVATSGGSSTLKYNVYAYQPTNKHVPNGMDYGLPVATAGKNYDLTISLNPGKGTASQATFTSGPTMSPSVSGLSVSVTASRHELHISGTATKATTTSAAISVDINYNNGSSYKGVEQAFSLEVVPQKEPLAISAQSVTSKGNLAAATAGQVYSNKITSTGAFSGDKVTYAFAPNDPLPVWMSTSDLKANGDLSFTPSLAKSSSQSPAGVYNLIVVATDQVTGATDSRVFQLVVQPDATTQPTFKVDSKANNLTLPLASPLVNYDHSITAAAPSGDTIQSLSWEMTGTEQLPPGLDVSVTGDTLAITGAPQLLNPNFNYYFGYPTTIQVTATDSSGGKVTEAFTLGEAYTPQQLQTAYGITGDGSGQTVVVLVSGDAPNLVSSTDPNFKYSDLYRYDQLAGLGKYSQPTPPQFFKVDAFGGTDYPAGSSSTFEITQDVEGVHALAPGANIVLMEYADYAGELTADQTAVTTLAATLGIPAPSVVTISYGDEESVEPPASTWLGPNLYNNPANTSPASFVFTAGDYHKTDSHQVEFREDMGTLVVGYTQMTTASSGGLYGAESAVLGSGGGTSIYGPQPLWQNGVVDQVSTSMQASPDVSFNGYQWSPPAFYNSYLGNVETSSVRAGAINYSWELGNGTSIAAPSWAGLLADVDEVRQAANSGLPNPLTDAETLTLLYSNAGTSAFHQVNQILDAKSYNDTTASNLPFPVSPSFGNYNPWGGLGSPNAVVLVPAMTAATVHASSASLQLGAAPPGTAGTVTSYTLSGVNLGATPISVVAPTGVQLSLNGTTWQTSLSFSPTPYSPNTVVYVRISPTAQGIINGQITNTSAGATEEDVTVTGMGQLPPFTPNYTDLDGYVTQIATITNANDTLTIFGIGSDNAVWFRQENVGNDPTSFGVWTSLGGYAKGLAVAPQGSGLPPAVFVIGGDNAAWVNETLTYGAWTSLGGYVKQLVAARDGNGKLELFAIGGDNAVYVDLQSSATSFIGWNDLGGYLTQIAVGQNGGSQTLQVFGIGGDHAAWTDQQTSLATPGTFTGWNSLGGYVQQVTVGQNQDGTLQLFVVGGDNAAWTNQQTTGDTYTSAGFTGWNSLGGYINDLTVARNWNGTLQFFGIGGDNAVWSRTQSTPSAITSANFSAYQNFGGYVKQVVAGINPSNQSVQFFGIGGDNAVYTKAQDLLLVPQLLAGTPLTDSGADTLTEAELGPIVAAAEARWEALGISASRFAGLQFEIDPIAVGWLGGYSSGTIYLDPTADGYGWFIDLTPGQDGEFTWAGGQERALPGSAAGGHIDLLTVVMHELGHALGLGDVAGGTDLMAESLAAGVRRTPTLADVDAAFRQ